MRSSKHKKEVQNGFTYYIPIVPCKDVQKFHVSVDYQDFSKAIPLLTDFLLQKDPPIYFKVSEYNLENYNSERPLRPSSWRVTCGAQFTIYMPYFESREEAQSYIDLQKEIEELLAKNAIKPGVIPFTDAVLNQYVSFRIEKGQDRVTKKWHIYRSDGLGAGHYNPGGFYHPFEEIIATFKNDKEKENRVAQSTAIAAALPFCQKT